MILLIGMVWAVVFRWGWTVQAIARMSTTTVRRRSRMYGRGPAADEREKGMKLGNGRAWTDGVEHGPPPPRGRPRVCGVRHSSAGSARPGQGRRDGGQLACRAGRQARDAAGDLDHGARRRRRVHPRASSRRCSPRTTPSSTAATRTITTTFAARRRSPRAASTTSTSARRAASGASSAATAR